ncbi:hypothetical protein SLS53_002439 [Cytospora paraplurivora]|uniref:Uncharacterized protein n=1 Tax=Cytospora paraplurivora TaxID=2898453 RepID=A0AAN9YL87_9PEZI
MPPPTQLIDRGEWSTFAPAFMQLAAQGPGVAPAQAMAERVNEILPFSSARLIVDMGCGPGQITAAILQGYSAELPTATRIIGADNNPQMLSQYAARRQKELDSGHEYWTRVETATTDIHDCAEFANDSVTHMLAGFVVFLVPEPVKAVEAIKLKLAPGGVFAFSSWESSEWQDLMYYPKKVRADLVMPSPPPDWTQPDSVRQHLQKVGFQDIEVVHAEGYLPFTDYEEICRFILMKMPLAARVVAQMSDEEVLQTHALMVSDLKAKYPTVPAKMLGGHNVAPSPLYDVLVVGGGPAGLSAALTLSRALHSVVVFDSGVYRNQKAQFMHTVPTWDHRSPAEYRAAARQELSTRYNTVTFHEAEVSNITKNNNGLFEASTVDSLVWKVSSAGVLAVGDLAAVGPALHIARQVQALVGIVNVYTNGSEELASAIQASIPAHHKSDIKTDARHIARLTKEHEGSQVTLHFAGISEPSQEGFLAHKPGIVLTGPFSGQLGLELTPEGDIKTMLPGGQTSKEGVFAVGDCGTKLKTIANAVATGSNAAAFVSAQVQAMLPI